ncbi:MAG: acyltransferase family protein [Clostridiales bacterium]|nr:acyltransferase family protein [Clostridiales bacterium]
MERENNRLSFVDIAKGICILMVVLGHIVSKEQGIHPYIYTMHIPTFILLSGFFEKKREKYLPYLKKIFKRLYLPFLCFVVIDFIAVMIIHKVTILYFLHHCFLAAVGLECVYDVPIWFLIDLFIVKAVFQLFHRIKNAKVLKVILIVAVVIGITYMYFFDYFELMNRNWALFALVPMLAYYCLGFILKDLIKYIANVFSGEKIIDKLFLTVIMIMCFGILIPISQINGDVSFFGCNFNNAFLFLINSLLGAFAIIILSCILSSFTKIKFKGIQFLGKHSLFIQVTHYYLVDYVIFAFFDKRDKLDLYYSPGVEALVFLAVVGVCIIAIIIKELLVKNVLSKIKK